MEMEVVENFLSLLESMINTGGNKIQRWAKIIPLENESGRDLLFNLKNCYPLVVEEGRRKKLFLPDMKTIRRRIKAMGAASKAAGIGSRVVKVWAVRREGENQKDVAKSIFKEKEKN